VKKLSILCNTYPLLTKYTFCFGNKLYTFLIYLFWKKSIIFTCVCELFIENITKINYFLYKHFTCPPHLNSLSVFTLSTKVTKNWEPRNACSRNTHRRKQQGVPWQPHSFCYYNMHCCSNGRFNLRLRYWNFRYIFIVVVTL